MSLPKYLHSNMVGAPALLAANGSTNAMLLACLVDGFNTQTPTSASSNGSSVSLVYAADPGFEVGSTIAISGATNVLYNGNFRVVTTGTTVTVANTSGPAGAVAGTLSTKYAPLGWTRPYSGAGIGCYQQGGGASHKRFVRVYDNTVTSTQRAYMRGYESMSGVSTGVGPFPTVAESSTNGGEVLSPYADGSTTLAVPWIIVGTPRAFYAIVVYGGVSGDKDPLAHTGNWGSLGFGELQETIVGDTYAYFCPGGYTWPAAANWGSRNYGGTNGSRTEMYPRQGRNTGFENAWPYPDLNLGGFLVTPKMLVWERNTSTNAYSYRGIMPGAIGLQHEIFTAGSGYNEGQMLTDVPGVTGRALLLNWYGGGAGYLVRLDEDWGDL